MAKATHIPRTCVKIYLHISQVNDWNYFFILILSCVGVLAILEIYFIYLREILFIFLDTNCENALDLIVWTQNWKVDRRNKHSIRQADKRNPSELWNNVCMWKIYKMEKGGFFSPEMVEVADNRSVQKKQWCEIRRWSKATVSWVTETSRKEGKTSKTHKS